MSQVKTNDDIKQLGTILCVWAHPDDESFMCAGIMAAAVRNGQPVVCVTATKGEAGVQDESRWPAELIGDIRSEEMVTALDHLGVKIHSWMYYHDGHCQEVPPEEAVAKIKDLIKQYHPNSILTFGPEGMTGHTDHKAVSHWVDQATEGQDIKIYHAVEEESRYNQHMIEADKRFDIYFNIDKPPIRQASDCDIAYELPPDILAKKRAALQSMPSQTERLFQNMSDDTIQAMLAQECFVLAKKS